MQSTPTRRLPHSRVIWITAAALAAVLLIGWGVRIKVTMSTTYPAGINAAYYLVQARAVLETGSLGLPDFPLLFYLDAVLAGMLSLFLPVEEAIMFVVRWTDALFPVLLAVPLAMFALAFPQEDKSRWTPALAVLLVGLIGVLNASLLRMSGDFQKNAFALPLSMAFTFFLYQAARRHRRRDIALAALFFVLTLLTHIGVAALALSMAGLFAGVTLLAHPDRKRSLLIAGGLLLVVCLTLSLVYIFDAARIERLLGVIFDPTGLLSTSTANPGRARIDWSNLWLGNLLGLIGIVTTAWHQKSLHPSERALLWAASLTALFFASPLISREWSQRLALMAFLPGLIPLVYVVVRRSWGWLAAGVVLLIVVFTTFRSPAWLHQRAITEEAYEELLTIGASIPEGENLIVAAHGLEWWVAWTMHTHISNRLELAFESWDEYDHIYIIDQLNPSANPSLGSGGQGQPKRPMRFPARPSAPLGAQAIPSQPPNAPGASQVRLSAQDTTLVFEGEFYSLRLIESKPDSLDTVQPPADELAQPTNSPGDTAAQATKAAPKTVALGSLAMVPRPAWNAAALDPQAAAETGFFDPQTNPGGILRYSEPLSDWLTTIIVHHTALAPSQGPHEIQQLHMGQRGYADIGYHFVIAPNGTLFEGRRIELRGAHTAGYNTGTIGVVLQGNMNIMEPTQEQLHTLAALIDYLRDTYGISHLAGHRDFNPDDTECPGDNLHPLLPALAVDHGLTFGTGGYQAPPWAK